ncbi:hypothetical protein K3G63_05270 [Hymenobacter sp. HSC-4F20]|uniref:hypothetical protein n=1 Tax=Hymenobacter sp. HSC-4F20 TaxID=2864135 RepID=UPI001C72D06B|nr:hypothetical protein [Hymenobacter sp. HSC-4F20]MBX0289837.1 hypothetical protein [Hymenobacter sp. HSC-4F20]
MANGLDIEARLVITLDGDDVQVAGSGGYLIINFPSQRVFDKITSGPPKDPNAPPKPKERAAAAVDPLQQLNDLARQLGLVLDLRVGGKTHVTFGTGRSAKITLNAVLGKIGSFFSR